MFFPVGFMYTIYDILGSHVFIIGKFCYVTCKSAYENHMLVIRNFNYLICIFSKNYPHLLLVGILIILLMNRQIY